jgi:Family of unknown function (DUF6114)
VLIVTTDHSTEHTTEVDIGHHAATPQTFWSRFHGWRRSRPFWGGLWTIVAGVEILLTELAPLPIVIHIGLTGLAGFAVPVLMILCGLMLWFAPQPRIFYASLILLLSLASWITSNLGGFIVGMLVGLVGGALAFTWTTAPRTKAPPPDAPL